MRRLVKACVFAVSVAIVAPFIVLAWIEMRALRDEVLFTLFAQFLALWPGRPGSYLRGAYYFGALDHCSWETHVGFGSMFTHRGGSLGARASMGAYCVIGHAQIGADVMIGSRVSIPSGKRQHFDEEGNLTVDARFDRVTIGAGTWVGEGAIIMASVGSGCVISAGAVVAQTMPDRTLIAGNPARAIRELR